MDFTSFPVIELLDSHCRALGQRNVRFQIQFEILQSIDHSFLPRESRFDCRVLPQPRLDDDVLDSAYSMKRKFLNAIVQL